LRIQTQCRSLNAVHAAAGWPTITELKGDAHPPVSPCIRLKKVVRRLGRGLTGWILEADRRHGTRHTVVKEYTVNEVDAETGRLCRGKIGRVAAFSRFYVMSVYRKLGINPDGSVRT
jgi:hypothetical protein